MNEGAPIQGFDVPVSALSIAHLSKLVPNVDGAFVLCQSTGTYWTWLSVLPGGLVTSADGSSGAITSSPGGFWVNTGLGPTGGGSVAQAQIRYVNKGGNDATGDGSFAKPFLTIQKALDSITDATTVKPYVVDVAPGVYATSFKLKSGIYIWGRGSGPGEYNGTPALGATVIAPNAAQALDATFAGAGDGMAGILYCSLSTALVCNFAAIGSTGPKALLLCDVFTDSAVTLTGSGNLEYATVQGLYINSASAFTSTNMGGGNIRGFVNDFGGGLVITQSAAIQGFYEISGSFCGSLTVTWTSALLANLLQVGITGRVSQNQPVISGVGAFVIADQSLDLIMSNADNRLSFGNNAAATLVGINHGYNVIQCTPTVARTLTIDRPGGFQGVTQILVVNQSGSAPIDLALQGGGISNGSPSYVPPGKSVLVTFDFRALGTTHWFVQPYVQSGSVQLAAGVSAFIPADIDATNSSIVATLKTFNGAAGTPSCKGADRVTGTRAGGGGFKVHAINLATGADLATDGGTYDWHVDMIGATS